MILRISEVFRNNISSYEAPNKNKNHFWREWNLFQFPVSIIDDLESSTPISQSCVIPRFTHNTLLPPCIHREWTKLTMSVLKDSVTPEVQNILIIKALRLKIRTDLFWIFFYIDIITSHKNFTQELCLFLP